MGFRRCHDWVEIAASRVFVEQEGLVPSSMSAWRTHLCSIIACTLKSVAICSIVTPSSRSDNAHDIVAELQGQGLAHRAALQAV